MLNSRRATPSDEREVSDWLRLSCSGELVLFFPTQNLTKFQLHQLLHILTGGLRHGDSDTETELTVPAAIATLRRPRPEERLHAQEPPGTMRQSTESIRTLVGRRSFYILGQPRQRLPVPWVWAASARAD